MTVERVLVIDDEPGVVRLCQRALKEEGFEVKGALNGEEGLQLLQGQSPGDSTEPVLSLSKDSPQRVVEGLHAFAAVPIKSKDKVLGVLGVFSRSPRQLGPQEVQLLTAIGHQIGVATENVQLAEEASEIGILQERDGSLIRDTS